MIGVPRFSFKIRHTESGFPPGLLIQPIHGSDLNPLLKIQHTLVHPAFDWFHVYGVPVLWRPCFEKKYILEFKYHCVSEVIPQTEQTLEVLNLHVTKLQDVFARSRGDDNCTFYATAKTDEPTGWGPYLLACILLDWANCVSALILASNCMFAPSS